MKPQLIASGEGNKEEIIPKAARLAKIEPTSAEITKKLNHIAAEIKKAVKNGDLEIKKTLEDQYDSLGEQLSIMHALYRNKDVLCLKK